MGITAPGWLAWLGTQPIGDHCPCWGSLPLLGEAQGAGLALAAHILPQLVSFLFRYCYRLFPFTACYRLLLPTVCYGLPPPTDRGNACALTDPTRTLNYTTYCKGRSSGNHHCLMARPTWTRCSLIMLYSFFARSRNSGMSRWRSR